LKNASKFPGSGKLPSSYKSEKSVIAWYEAQGKKRPHSPSPDNCDKGERRRSAEGTSRYPFDDVAVELIVKSVEQKSSLVRGCRKESVVRARASVEELVGVRTQGLSLK
jgi:hypothetical protein